MLEVVGMVVIPSLTATMLAIGWFHDRSSKHMDRKFAEVSKLISTNEAKVEKIEGDLLQLQMRLPKEFIMREEFLARMSDGAKKVDYLVEQVDAIKNMLMFGRERS